MKATYNPYEMNPNPSRIGRYWTRATFDDGSTADNPASSAEEALAHACVGSLELKASIDAMDGATVLATYRGGKAAE